jgi:hypothetical protein
LLFRAVLEKLMECEEKQRHSKEEAEAHAKELTHHSEAFIENLDGDQLFSAMFESDTHGKALLTIGNTAMDIYNKYPLHAQHRVCRWAFVMTFLSLVTVNNTASKLDNRAPCYNNDPAC